MRILALILMGLLTLTALGCSGNDPDVTQEMQGYMQGIEATVEARLAEERAIESRIEVEVEAKIAEMIAFAEKYDSRELTATPVVVATPAVADGTPVVVATPAVADTPVVVATPVVDDTPVVVATPVVDDTPVVVTTPAESIAADDSNTCAGYGQYIVTGTVAGYPDGTRILGVVADKYIGSTTLVAAYYELIIDLCAEDGTSLENKKMKFNVGGKTANQEITLTSGASLSLHLTVP